MRLRYLIAFIVAVSVSLVTFGQSVTVTAKLDSARMLMGRLSALRLEVVKQKSLPGQFEIFSKAAEDGIIGICGDSVELRAAYKCDTSEIGSERIQINYTVPIQSFDSGCYQLPEFRYISGRDTFRTTSLLLEVSPVPVNEDAQISDYAPVQEPSDGSIFDNVPQWMVDFWWLILLLLIMIGLTIWGIIRYRDKGYIIPRKPEPSPYAVAISSLRKLRQSKPWERGLEKEYFTRLTEILRVYLEKRFGINAMEMTSNQIVKTLADNKSICEKRGYIGEILTMADFVKFAKVRPLPEDSISALTNAEKFVEETKPSEEEEQQRAEALRQHQEALAKHNKVARKRKIKSSTKKGGKK